MAYGTTNSFCPSPTILEGMTTDQLQAALTSAQAALGQLMTGGKIVSASYTKGDGSQSVTFAAADRASLALWIRMLQQQLGIIPHARRAIAVSF